MVLSLPSPTQSHLWRALEVSVGTNAWEYKPENKPLLAGTGVRVRAVWESPKFCSRTEGWVKGVITDYIQMDHLLACFSPIGWSSLRMG